MSDGSSKLGVVKTLWSVRRATPSAPETKLDVLTSA